MRFDKKLGYLLSPEDINRLVDHDVNGTIYKLLPLEVNDISDTVKGQIKEMIRLSKSKPHICEKAGINTAKLDLFLKEQFKTKKITVVRQILALGVETIDDLSEEDLVVRKSPKKKESN